MRIKDFCTRARTSLLSRAYLWLAWGSFLAAAAAIVIHLRFVVLPLSLFLLGSVSYLLAGRKSLYLFLFLLPLVNSLPSLFFNGYPFNYMAMALFALAGMGAASLLKKEQLSFAFPGSRIYLLFLALLWLSVLFVFLRWSNLIHSPLAFFRDTPITPEGQRLSFGVIFPVATLFLFSFSPLLVALVGHHRFSVREALPPLSLGLSLSVGLALVQKTIYPGFLHQKWWLESLGHVNGGFSDYNAFGFFSGLVFLWQAVTLIDDWQTAKAWRRIAAVPFLLTSLAGISLSGCRTALLFVLAAFVYVLFSRKIPLWLRAIFVSTLVILFFAAGGTLKSRVYHSFDRLQRLKDTPNLMQGLDNLTFGRVMMIKNSFSLVRRFPLQGVGAGNFLFYLKYDNYKKVYWEDLPLNQYLLILDELGFAGLVVFMVFLWNLGRASTRSQRFLLLGAGLALLFNFFLWFPECILLFFILFAANPVKDSLPPAEAQLGHSRGRLSFGLVPAGAYHGLAFAGSCHLVRKKKARTMTMVSGIRKRARRENSAGASLPPGFFCSRTILPASACPAQPPCRCSAAASRWSVSSGGASSRELLFSGKTGMSYGSRLPDRVVSGRSVSVPPST